MTLQGTLLLDTVAIIFLLWVLNLVRTGRLYVGYGVILTFAIGGAVFLVSTPWILGNLAAVIGVQSQAFALTLLALGFITMMLIYVLAQITILSNRLSTLVQELAMEHAGRQAEVESEEHGSEESHLLLVDGDL